MARKQNGAIVAEELHIWRHNKETTINEKTSHTFSLSATNFHVPARCLSFEATKRARFSSHIFFITYILDYAYLKYNYNVIFVYLKSHLIAAVITVLQWNYSYSYKHRASFSISFDNFDF